MFCEGNWTPPVPLRNWRGSSLLLTLIIIILPPLALLLLLYTITRPHPTRIPIKNRHVLITGSSSGIGLALANRFALLGARVTILARNSANLEHAKNSIKLSTGVDVTTVSADVTDYDALKKAIDGIDNIDLLVCNQGVFVPCEIEKQSLDEIKFMIDVNLIGNFNLIKAALPYMKVGRKDRGPGSIAIMSSQAGLADYNI